MIRPGGCVCRMSGRGYTVFDTAVGRCGIAWGEFGVLGVQLPEAREIETRRRLFQLFPDARELRPHPEIQSAIDGIAGLLRGKAAYFSEVRLDMTGVRPFDARVYEFTRTIPRGETLTYAEVAARL